MLKNFSKILSICLIFSRIAIAEESVEIKFSEEEINYIHGSKEGIVYISSDMRATINKLNEKGIIQTPEHDLKQLVEACAKDWKVIPVRVAEQAIDQVSKIVEENKGKLEDSYEETKKKTETYKQQLATKEAQFFFGTRQEVSNEQVVDTGVFNTLIVNDILRAKNILRVNYPDGSLAFKVEPLVPLSVCNVPLRVDFQQEGTNALTVIGRTQLNSLSVNGSAEVTNHINCNSLKASDNIVVDGHLNLSTNPSTADSGMIKQDHKRYIHNSGDKTNFFAGLNSANTSITGTNNVAVGNRALLNTTTGNNNVGIGFEALNVNTTGIFNTAVGSGALLSNTNGTNNTALGFQAGALVTTGDQNIHINHKGTSADDRTIRIGTTPLQTRCFIAGIRGVAVPGGLSVFIDSNGQLGTSAPSVRYKKKDIQEIPDISEKIANLKAVTFKYKDDQDEATQYGLIAEDVEELLPDLVARNKEGQVESIKYEFLPILLLNELQKMRLELKQQKERILQLEKSVNTK